MAIPFALPLQAPITDENKLATSENVPDSLKDIAVAGEGITFTKPFVVKDYTVEGSPTVSSDGEVNGFSDSDYLTAINPINAEDSLDSFEIYTAIKEDSVPTSNYGIIDVGAKDSTSFRLSVADTQNSIRLRVSTDGSWTYPVDIIGSTILETNKKYFVKVTYSSASGYALFSSVDGVTWTLEGTSSVLTRPYKGSVETILIGDNTASDLSFDGSIYLNDTCINVNGERAWTAWEELDKTGISSNVDLAGYLKNNGDDRAVVIESEDGTERVVADGAVLRAEGYSVAIGSGLSYGHYDVVIGSGVSSSGNSANHLSVVIGHNAKSTNFRSVSIGEGTRSDGGVAIGEDANASSASVALYGTAGYGSVAIGKYSNSSGSYSISMGYSARATASNAIQIGQGANSTANTMSVGLSDSLNVQLLDADGQIPAERLTNVLGDIETLLAAL